MKSITINALDTFTACSRIERAPNASRLVDAYDAALGGSDVSVHRTSPRGTEWQVWHGEYSGFCGDFHEIRIHLAEAAQEEPERRAEEAVPVMIPQPVQQQQACAAPAETVAEVAVPEAEPALDPTTIEGIRALLVGRSAVISMPMGDVKYRIVGVRRWTSPDGAQVRDYVDVEDEGMARDDRKGPKSIHIVRAGTSRGVKHDSPVGQVRYVYGSLCNSGAKEARADTLIEDLFAVKLDARG